MGLLKTEAHTCLGAHVRAWRKGEVAALANDTYDGAVIFLQEAVRQELERTDHSLRWVMREGWFLATIQYKRETRYLLQERNYGLLLARALQVASCIHKRPSARGAMAGRCFVELKRIEQQMLNQQLRLEAALDRAARRGRWDF